MGEYQMRQIFTSIDIGSNSIKAIVCELYNNKLNLLAATHTPSIGIKKGLITDGEAAMNCIRKAIDHLEGQLGISLRKVIVTVPSYMAEFKIAKASIPIQGEHHIVTLNDMEEVSKKAIQERAVSEKEIVTDLTIDFGVDDKTKIINPKGLMGDTLHIRTLLVMVPKKNIYSVIKVLEALQLDVVDISLNAIGDMATFKTKEMGNSLSALINIGYETVTISIHNKGIIIKNSILNKGAKNILKDLIYIYKISQKEAMFICQNFAFAHKRNASMNDFYETENTLGEKVKINQREASEIIMARIEEILTLARKEITNLLNKEIDYVIVTGGVSNMRDFEYMVSDIFGKDSIIGNVKMLGIRDNIYSSAIGNVIHFINKLKQKEEEYTMVSESESLKLSEGRRKQIEDIHTSSLGQVFNYFWSK